MSRPVDTSQTSGSEERPDTAIMRGPIAFLCLDGRAAEAAIFYQRAFGARDVGRYPDADHPGRFMNIHLEINGGSLMLTDCRAPWEKEGVLPQGFNLTLAVTDGEHWWSRAVAAGCSVLMPYERQFWGDNWGLLKDPFGIEWAIDEPAC